VPPNQGNRIAEPGRQDRLESCLVAPSRRRGSRAFLSRERVPRAFVARPNEHPQPRPERPTAAPPPFRSSAVSARRLRPPHRPAGQTPVALRLDSRGSLLARRFPPALRADTRQRSISLRTRRSHACLSDGRTLFGTNLPPRPRTRPPDGGYPHLDLVADSDVIAPDSTSDSAPVHPLATRILELLSQSPEPLPVAHLRPRHRVRNQRLVETLRQLCLGGSICRTQDGYVIKRLP